MGVNSLMSSWSRLSVFAWPKRSDWRSVVLWWELRRIPYNILVGTVGIVSMILTFWLIVASGELEPGEDAIEPIAWFGLPFLGAIFFNVCYTAGWAVELIVRSNLEDGDQPTLAPSLLTAGLALSLAIVLAPAVLWSVADIVIWLTP